MKAASEKYGAGHFGSVAHNSLDPRARKIQPRNLNVRDVDGLSEAGIHQYEREHGRVGEVQLSDDSCAVESNSFWVDEFGRYGIDAEPADKLRADVIWFFCFARIHGNPIFVVRQAADGVITGRNMTQQTLFALGLLGLVPHELRKSFTRKRFQLTRLFRTC